MLFVRKKAVISGSIIEFYEYGKPVAKGFKQKHVSGRSGQATSEEKQLNREKVQQRAKRDLRRLINANAWQWRDETDRPYKPVFLTLTFAENLMNISMANDQFRTFMKRLNYEVTKSKKQVLKYVVVIEFQNRGAIHYHVVIFNMPYISASKIGEIWGNGFIKINAIEDIDNIGSYVSKYMGKDLQDDRLVGQKCYFSSRGLMKPVEILESEKVEQLVSTLPCENLVYSSSFENEYTGTINYNQYNTGLLNNKYRK